MFILTYYVLLRSVSFVLAGWPAGRCDHDVPLAPLYVYESART